MKKTSLELEADRIEWRRNIIQSIDGQNFIADLYVTKKIKEQRISYQNFGHII